MSMEPKRALGGAREGVCRKSPTECRTVVLKLSPGRTEAGSRRGRGDLADCQDWSRTNAVRSISPLISTSCTPKYTTFGILEGVRQECPAYQDVASKPIRGRPSALASARWLAGESGK